MKLHNILLAAVLALFCLTTSYADHTVRHSANQYTVKMTVRNGVCGAVMVAPGRALTATHCLARPDAKLHIDGTVYPVFTGYALPGKDVSIIIVPGAPCPCAPVRGTPGIEGEWVVVVGFPYDVAKVTTYGEVQARITNPEDGQDYVLATAPVAPGNSGGGVYDLKGNLLGISSASDPRGQMALYVEVLDISLKDEMVQVYPAPVE
jgi:S1-C subfamily serine protease